MIIIRCLIMEYDYWQKPVVDASVVRFMQDDFLRSFIVRTVLCTVILRYHLSFKEEKASTPCVWDSLWLMKMYWRSSSLLLSLILLPILHCLKIYFRRPKSLSCWETWLYWQMSQLTLPFLPVTWTHLSTLPAKLDLLGPARVQLP
jgi:hypothetical protein